MRTKFEASWIMAFVILLVGTGGCNFRKPIALATFTPSEYSPFRITFSYPADWEWKTPPDKTVGTLGVMTTVVDPESHGNGVIWIFISVYISPLPENIMSNEIHDLLKTKTSVRHFEVVESKLVQIDGQEAQWFITRDSQNAGTAQPYIGEDIFFLFKDRNYRIGLRYPESESGRTFYDEFQAMIASIKFLP
jgi:hypothetical protein